MTPSPARRHAIIAGRGRLPLELALRLEADGERPFLIRMAGEAGAELERFDGIALPLERLGHALPAMKAAGVTDVVFAGGVNRRPRWGSLRMPARLLPLVPAIALRLTRGDNDLLSFLVGALERNGFAVRGAHDILPDHVAGAGRIGALDGAAITDDERQAAIRACLAIGALDIGQAVAAAGRRIIAVEGVEGTDAMLARVAQLRADGRVGNARPLFMVKLAKPAQELRADMPTIGPQTIDSAQAAGIRAIFVSAGNTLIMEAGETIRRADAAGVALIGLEAEAGQ